MKMADRLHSTIGQLAAADYIYFLATARHHCEVIGSVSSVILGYKIFKSKPRGALELACYGVKTTGSSVFVLYVLW